MAGCFFNPSFLVQLLALTLYSLSLPSPSSCLEIPQLHEVCSTCIQSSPRFWFSCNKCYDDPSDINYCGYTVNNLL